MAHMCFTGLHVGWYPDKPSGDQTESKGLSGKTTSPLISYFLYNRYKLILQDMIHYNRIHLLSYFLFFSVSSLIWFSGLHSAYEV